MVRYRVAHDFTVVHVQYWRQVALVHADVYLRHVGSPLLIGSGRGEVAVHYVRGRLADLSLVRTVLVPFADVLQKFLPHDPADGLVVDSEAFVPELRIDSAGRNSPCSVRVSTLSVHVLSHSGRPFGAGGSSMWSGIVRLPSGDV